MNMLMEDSPLYRTSAERFVIEPTYRLPVMTPNSFLDTIRVYLERLIPPSFFAEIESNDQGAASPVQRLHAALPMIYSPLVELHQEQEAELSLPIFFLCPAQFTHGLGRYIKDTLSRWLIPGMQVPIVGQISLHFHFVQNPDIKFYFTQQLIGIHNREEREEIAKRIGPLINEMKINITAVYQARDLLSIKQSPRLQRDEEEPLHRVRSHQVE